MDFFLTGLIVLFVVIILPIIAFNKANRALAEIDRLREEVRRLARDLASAERVSPEQAPATEETPVQPSVPAAVEEIVAPVAEPEAVPDAETIEPEPVMAAPQTLPPSMEERLTSRWFVWLGGVALALGGVFLVKYSFDMGLLGPKTRVTLGILLGIALVIAGEVVRQRPMQRAIAAVKTDYVPAALSAAGIAVGYASVYVGYLFYDLYSPLIAFAALAIVSLFAIGLALLQGPFIAALGLVGGYVTPILAATGQPNALGLFPYLLLVTVAGVGILRHRGWAWLLWLTIAGAAAWIFFWYGVAFAPGDTPVIGLYILVLFGLFTYFRRRFTGVPGEEAPAGLEFRLDRMPMPERAVAVLYSILVAATFFLVTSDHFARTSVVFFALVVVVTLFLGRREQIFAAVPRLAGLAAVALIVFWDLPLESAFAPTFYWPMSEPLLPAELIPIAIAAAVWAAIFAIGGFVSLWGAARPGHWAALSASVPIALLTVLHARLNHFHTNLSWAPVAILVAAMSLAGAARCAKYRDTPGINGALGAYAVGVIAAMSLAFAMTFDEAWLTIAVALQIPGIAYVDSKLDVKALRTTALVAAGVVIVRLLANVEIFRYGTLPGDYGLSWILYGYGLPALCFIVARRLFGPRAGSFLSTVLEAGALAFAVALISFEIRHLIAPHGRLDRAYSSPLEHALQTLAWLSVALILYWRSRPDASPVVRWGWKILGGVAIGHIVLIELVLYNPLFPVVNVGALPILNTLLLAFGIPALFAVAFMRIAQRREDESMGVLAGVSALALAFIWLTFEVRHAFHGAMLGIGDTTTAELYTYSAVWLLFGAGLLALGLWRRSAPLRHASLAMILLTVAKVFLYDMSLLTGLYRVLSFLGLGLALVAIGFLYQRFVFPVAKPKPQS